MATPTTLPSTFVAGNVLTALQMNDLRGAFRILQVVNTTKTDTFTTTSTSMTDITGLSVSITPSATSSLVFVIATVQAQGQSATTDGFLQLMRGTTAIGIGDAAGSRQRAGAQVFLLNAAQTASHVMFTLDSPATTSATTYKVQIRAAAAGTMYVNRTQTDTDSSAWGRFASSITVFEVSA